MRHWVRVGAADDQAVYGIAFGRQHARDHLRRPALVGNPVAGDIDHPALAGLGRGRADLGGMNQRLADGGGKISPGAPGGTDLGGEGGHRPGIGQPSPVGHLSVAGRSRPMCHGDQRTALKLANRRDQRGVLEGIRQTVRLQIELTGIDAARHIHRQDQLQRTGPRRSRGQKQAEGKREAFRSGIHRSSPRIIS